MGFEKRVLDDTQVIADMFRAVEWLYDPEPEKGFKRTGDSLKKKDL